ncbi:sodium/hydrogen exchanger 9B2 isoform X2 [Artibeus jamaicensis]|uniref:sodium/hydrogen exchanger 9B2 isoform X2 n=1 Tax=Artibeus jamaicensis TaxID=9417 RepID=UPI00235AAF3F|nr:sodium/hydrogen exchanger 9B2 isoform X2 [Artibeus jamaicensis]
MEDESKTIEHEDLKPTGVNHTASMYQETQEETVMNFRGIHGNEPIGGSSIVNTSERSPQETPAESNHLQRLKQAFTCPPHGLLDRVITNVTMIVLLWAIVWSITGSECLPGGNLFGIIILFICAIIGGKIMGLIKLPTLPPLPPLLGMLLAGFLIRNIPVISENVQIKHRWSSALRSLALSVILVRAGLGLDSKALKKLKGVCVRLSMGPCLMEACTSALLSHFLMGLPWQWAFMLGFVLGAVSPAVVVPSMLLLQEQGYGVEKGVPTLLMAAGSFDDILCITGFNTCLGMAFSTGQTGVEASLPCVGAVGVCSVQQCVLRLPWLRRTLHIGPGFSRRPGVGQPESRGSENYFCCLGHFSAPSLRTHWDRGIDCISQTGNCRPLCCHPGHCSFDTNFDYISDGVFCWFQHKGKDLHLFCVASEGHSPGCNRICRFGHSKITRRQTVRRIWNGCVDSGISKHPHHGPNWKYTDRFAWLQASPES